MTGKKTEFPRKALVVVLGAEPKEREEIVLLTQKLVHSYEIEGFHGGEFLNVEKLPGNNQESLMESLLGVKLLTGEFSSVIFCFSSDIGEGDFCRIVEKDIQPVDVVFPKEEVLILRTTPEGELSTAMRVQDGLLFELSAR